MTRQKTLLNVAIIVALAALVYLLGTSSTAVAVFWQVISLAFLALLAFIGSRLYREHRITIYSLGPKRRAVLYGAVALAAVTFTASDRLLVDPVGTVVWLLLLGGAGYAMYSVYRSSKQY